MNRFEDPQRMTAQEAHDVLERVARRDVGADHADLRTMPRVEDVAEALHLDVVDVQDLLHQVRTTPPAPPKEVERATPWMAYSGWAVAALTVIAAIALVRPTPETRFVPPVAPPGMTMPKTLSLRPLQEVSVIPMDLTPPAGFDIGVKAHGVVLSVAAPRDVRPREGVSVRQQLVDAIALLAQRAEEIGASHAFEPGQFNVVDGFSPKIEVWINGNGRGTSITLGSEMHTGPSSIATLKSRRLYIDRCLDSLFTKGGSIGPESGQVGVVFPPSGFQVTFRGRRTAGMNSSPLVTVPLDEKLAVARLEKSMRAMMDADLKPVEGRWRQDAEIEKGLKTPDESHFTVETVDGLFEFDIPTKPGTSVLEQNRILHEKSVEAVREYQDRGRGKR